MVFLKKYYYVRPTASEKLEKANGRKGGYPSLSLEGKREVPSSYQVSESFFKQVFLQSPEEVSI